MKRLIAVFIMIALCLSLCACTIQLLPPKIETESTAQPTRESATEVPSEKETNSTQTTVEVSPNTENPTPLLYRVSGDNGSVLYLLGSIHVGDERATRLPDYVMQAYEESDFLAVECDVLAAMNDMGLQMELLQKLLLTDGTKTYDHLSEETYQKAKSYLAENGMYMSLYDSYHPSFWFSLVENAVLLETGLDSNLGIDMQFLQLAHDEGKEIREVESAEFQYDMLVSFSDELVDLLIRSTIQFPRIAAAQNVALYEAWLRGNEEELLTFLGDPVMEDEREQEMYEDYSYAMITDRNIGMAATAEQYLSEGSTGFFVVGMGHILGEGGVADLLGEAGYAVEQVRP